MRACILSAVIVAAAVSSVHAAPPQAVKIGLVATFSGPFGAVGQAVSEGFALALETNGGKLGGLPVEMIKQDDQGKPDVGLQAATKMVEQDKVDIMIGPIFTNVLLAAYPPVVQAKVIVISPVAGPAELAGKFCTPYFFSTSWQNSDTAASMGQHLQDINVKNLYLQVPNFEGGREVVAGVKRYYKGRVVKEAFSPMAQQDFSTELTEIRSAAPDAVFAFYPGNLAINFIKQYTQAGLMGKIPLFTASTIDATNLAAMGDAPVGSFQTASWNADLPIPASQEFVAAFKKRYDRTPSYYAAYAYDAARLLDGALRQAGGATDRAGLIAALAKADFASVRGKLTFGPNHFPRQDFYLLEAVKTEDGTVKQQTRGVVFKDHGDDYVAKCNMPKS